jgi:NAD(P)-dependent dehydrogenase (short-subunit alcohol dehydrogenase family)
VRLAGHHALVTGAGTGIGAAIACALGAEGAKLTLVGRRREPLENVARSNLEALVAPADVTDPSQVQTVLKLARDAHGPLSILVNNAGAAESVPFGKLSIESWRRMMSVNLDALLHCCQAALPDLLKVKSGRIITIASTAALRGYAYTAAYVAAKHGALGLTRALAIEYAASSLTVNAVCPGFTDTALVAEAVAMIRTKTGRSEEQSRAALTRFNPQGRLIKPDEVASAVVWLCLSESRSVNGQAIAVSGGEVT